MAGNFEDLPSNFEENIDQIRKEKAGFVACALAKDLNTGWDQAMVLLRVNDEDIRGMNTPDGFTIKERSLLVIEGDTPRKEDMHDSIYALIFCFSAQMKLGEDILQRDIVTHLTFNWDIQNVKGRGGDPIPVGIPEDLKEDLTSGVDASTIFHILLSQKEIPIVLVGDDLTSDLVAPNNFHDFMKYAIFTQENRASSPSPEREGKYQRVCKFLDDNLQEMWIEVLSKRTPNDLCVCKIPTIQ